ncbi:hypothetical protein [Neobacillus niacini]|uniref:hypothetical protein n=1 Tax=Neobacillus niacini TaxID=86668 RepID=UPI0021CB98DB|nr:hypothetical protein [Neobacillus niacini]MCM3764318.1 hypothetical protein [Neobacillus niacini]
MWYWIAAFFVILVVFEEVIYYILNRYLFGKKVRTDSKLRERIMRWIRTWKSKNEEDIRL